MKSTNKCVSFSALMIATLLLGPTVCGAAVSGSVLDTISVGQTPVAIASDGTHVWVVNNGSNSVSEVQISNDTVVRTIAVGSNPWGITSDGTDVWVTNWDSQNVSEIQISTGTVVNTIPVRSGPWGISSDGSDVWVADETSGSVSEIQISTGIVLRTISVGGEPQGISSDGTNVWVANYLGGVTEIEASTGTILRTIPVGNSPWAISSNGTNVWVANSGSSNISEIQASTGVVVKNIQLGYQPQDVSTDGTTVWVANYSGGSVTEIEAATGDVVKRVDLPNSPYAISTDGTDVWVANAGVVNSISKIAVKGSPGAPQSLTDEVPSDGQIVNFSWIAPFDGGSPISGYSVQTSSDGINWSTTLEPAGTSSFSSDLNSTPNFYFQVAAINFYGVGAYASITISRTTPLSPTTTSSVSNDGRTASFGWTTPADGDSAIVSYLVQMSTDGVNWTSSNVSSTTFTAQATLQPGMGIGFRVAAVNSLGVGAFSATSFANSPGLAPRLVQVLTSTGQPVSGGLVTWAAENVFSSVNYGLTAAGKVLFPSGPSGSVHVTVTNGVMPDGSYVSGTFNATFGYPVNIVTLPPEPSSAATTVTVEAPDGATLPGAVVSIPGNAVHQTVHAYDQTTTFTAPQVINSGTTDASGSFVLSGFINQGTTANVVYNDGVITQTVTPLIASSSVIATLPYGPVTLYPIVSNAAVTAGSLVSVTLATSSTGPNFRGGVSARFTGTNPRVSAGLPVRAVLPSGYKSCRGQVLTGTTNSQGKVTLKFCAAKTAAVKFVAGGAGAYVSKVFQVYVKGTAPTAPLGTLASTPQLGHASLSWTAPAFNGGSPITKYVVTLSAAGKRTVVVNATSTHVNVGGLDDATRYSVSVVASNKTGKSPAATLKVSVA
jgi:YVTN family beta-propeller protein